MPPRNAPGSSRAKLVAMLKAARNVKSDDIIKYDPFVGGQGQVIAKGTPNWDQTALDALGLDDLRKQVGESSDEWGKVFENTNPPEGSDSETYFSDTEGPTDAYRHLILGGEMRRRYGRLLGYLLSSGHELTTDIQDGDLFQGDPSNDQDYHNNWVGGGLAKDAKSFDDVKASARTAITKTLLEKGSGYSKNMQTGAAPSPMNDPLDYHLPPSGEPMIMDWAHINWPRLEKAERTRVLKQAVEGER